MIFKLISKNNNFFDSYWKDISTILVFLFLPIAFFRLARRMFLGISLRSSLRVFILFLIIGVIARYDSDLLTSILILVFIMTKKRINNEVVTKENYENSQNKHISRFLIKEGFFDIFFALLYISIFLTINFGLGRIFYGKYECIRDFQIKIQYAFFDGLSIWIFTALFLIIYNNEKLVNKVTSFFCLSYYQYYKRYR